MRNTTTPPARVFSRGVPDEGSGRTVVHAAEAGDVLWADTNSDGVIDENDRTVLGNAYPKFTAGFNTSLSWKNIDLGVVLTGSYGASVINFQKYYLYNMEGSSNQDYLGHGPLPLRQRSGTQQRLPRRTPLDDQRLATHQFAVRRRRFLPAHLEHLAGLHLPAEADFEACGCSNCGSTPRSTTSGPSPTTRGYNPEVSYKSSNLLPGFDWGCYPLSRTYSLGVRITF